MGRRRAKARGPTPPPPLAGPLTPTDAASLSTLVAAANAALDRLHLHLARVRLPAVGGQGEGERDVVWAAVNTDPDAAATAHGAPYTPPELAFLRGVLELMAVVGGVAGEVGVAEALAVDAVPRAEAAPASPAGDAPAAPRIPPKALPRAARAGALHRFADDGWLRTVAARARDTRDAPPRFAIGPRSFLELRGLLLAVDGVPAAVREAWEGDL